MAVQAVLEAAPASVSNHKGISQSASFCEGAILALPASAAAPGASVEPQADNAKQATPAPDVAAAQQPQHASSHAALNSSSRGPAEAAEPDLAQAKVKREPSADDSDAGQPHQATNGLPGSAHAAQEQEHLQEAGSSSHAEHLVNAKQERTPSSVEPMQVDAPPENEARHREGFREGSSGEAGSARSAEASAAEKSAVEPYRERREQPGSAAEGAVVAPEEAVQVAPMSADEAAERCELLCALCTKSPGLLRLLMEVFGKVQRGSLEDHSSFLLPGSHSCSNVDFTVKIH